MFDYPDTSHLPNVVFISMEELYPEIELIQGFQKANQLNEISFLMEEAINVVTVNSNYHDNLMELLDTYTCDTGETVEDKYTLEIFSNFLLKFCELLSNKLKEIRLYSEDDTSYYRLHQCHSLMLFSLIKIIPVNYHHHLN